MKTTRRIQQLAGLLILLALPLATGCFSMAGAVVGGTVGSGIGLVSGTIAGTPGEGLRNGCSDGMMAGMLVGGKVDMAVLGPLDDWRDGSEVGPESELSVPTYADPIPESALAISDVINMRNEGTPPFRVVEEIRRRGTSEPLSDPALRLLASHRIEVEIVEALSANYRAGPSVDATGSVSVAQSVGYPPPSLPYPSKGF